jgi:hypothetical protein
VQPFSLVEPSLALLDAFSPVSEAEHGRVAGMTLDYVIVNLKYIFAEGQVYVALSRARSMDGLQIIGNASRSIVKYVLSTLTSGDQP